MANSPSPQGSNPGKKQSGGNPARPKSGQPVEPVDVAPLEITPMEFGAPAPTGDFSWDIEPVNVERVAPSWEEVPIRTSTTELPGAVNFGNTLESNVASGATTSPRAVANAIARGNSSAADSNTPVQNSTVGSPEGGSDESNEELASDGRRRGRFFAWTVMPSWLVSLLFHVGFLLVLAAYQLEPVRNAIAGLSVSSVTQESAEVESFEISEASAPESAVEEEMSSEVPSEAPMMQTTELADVQLDTAMMVTAADISSPGVVEQLAPASMLSSVTAQATQSLSSRSSGMKRELIERYGGNKESEKAVAMALAWLAAHQLPNGAWTFGHNRVCRNQCKNPGDYETAVNAATAVALLPFLGAGQTHMEGQYKDTVKKGLAFLIKRMEVTPGDIPRGSWHEPSGNMYSHGLASIAICEAYAMTKDPDLAQPAQLALNFIAYAQNPNDGGWRYAPREPGDTSVVGWQLMALKSGLMGGLVIYPETIQKATFFLNSVSVDNGAKYGYDRPSADTGVGATTAIGLLCRMYLGTPKENAAMTQGVKLLSERGPDVSNVYFNYYASQVLRQFGGAEWEKWNGKMRDQLVNSQEKSGHAAGSWATGTETDGAFEKIGGRLYVTAMSCMILEVYYRYMPLYGDKSVEEDFEL